MPRSTLLLLLALTAGVALPGAARADDGKGPAPPAEPPKSPAAKPDDGKAPADAAGPGAKAEEKAPAEKADETPVAGTLYSVKLKTGRTVRGVVHVAGSWERRDRVQGWVQSKRDEKGAGLRLWYPSLLDGFLFIPAKDIEQFEDLGPLSAEDGLRIARGRNEAASRAESEREQLKAEAQERIAREEAAAAERAEVDRTRKEAATAGSAKAAAGGGSMVPLDRAKRFAELLEQYPPTVWHPETPKEIERRRVTLDLFPTDEEKEFLAVYAEWREAFEFWKKGAEGAAADPSAAADAKSASPK